MTGENFARRGALLILAMLLLTLGLVAVGDDSRAASERAANALAEGNRLFRDGQLEQALAVYREGYSPHLPHPTLVYNLATTLHHLDRLPEAILWYRRAASSQDPWLEENLWLARRSLGSQVFQPGGVLGHLGLHTVMLRWLAVALAWTGLLLVALPRFGSWPVALCAVLCILLYGGALGIERWGPRAAVLLSDCSSPAGDLPAGTEAWVQPSIDGGWRISGTLAAVCPPESVALVVPAS